MAETNATLAIWIKTIAERKVCRLNGLCKIGKLGKIVISPRVQRQVAAATKSINVLTIRPTATALLGRIAWKGHGIYAVCQRKEIPRWPSPIRWLFSVGLNRVRWP